MNNIQRSINNGALCIADFTSLVVNSDRTEDLWIVAFAQPTYHLK